MYHNLGKIPDAVGIHLLTYLSLHELERMRGVSIRWMNLADHDLLWKRLVSLLVVDKQPSVVSSMLLSHMTQKKKDTNMSWRRVYWQLDADGVRTNITEEEICRLHWAFSDGERLCDFQPNHTLKMEGFGKLVWRLNVKNAVVINDFPDHIVERLPNWGWVMKNAHIYILTVEKEKQFSTRDDINKAFEEARKKAGNYANSLSFSMSNNNANNTNNNTGNGALAQLLYSFMTRLADEEQEEKEEA